VCHPQKMVRAVRGDRSQAVEDGYRFAFARMAETETDHRVPSPRLSRRCQLHTVFPHSSAAFRGMRRMQSISSDRLLKYGQKMNVRSCLETIERLVTCINICSLQQCVVLR